MQHIGGQTRPVIHTASTIASISPPCTIPDAISPQNHNLPFHLSCITQLLFIFLQFQLLPSPPWARAYQGFRITLKTRPSGYRPHYQSHLVTLLVATLRIDTHHLVINSHTTWLLSYGVTGSVSLAVDALGRYRQVAYLFN
jgi:hypothetical protein